MNKKIYNLKIKKILIIRNDRFGEFLLNIPAMRALKEAYPEAKLSLAVNPAVCELAAAVECVDEVLVWNEVKGNLRRHKFDLCVVLNPTKEAHWAVFWAGIPVAVGYDRKWGFLLTHKMKDTKSLAEKHEVEYNLDLVGLIGARTSDKSISLARLPASNRSEYSGAVAIHPFTSDPVKQWPVERFMELAQRIAQDMKVKVVLVGNQQGTPCAAEFSGENQQGTPCAAEFSGENQQGTPCVAECPLFVDLINKTSLIELAQILKQCKLLVTCDSGPMHLSAAVETPVVALFRNDLPGKTAKRWGPWGQGHTILEKSNLLDISVEEVIIAGDTLLRRVSPAR